jgi:uncharacterized membrane protein
MTNPLRFLKAQPRFFTAALVGILLWILLPSAWRPSTRLLAAWDCATGLYLTLALVMMAGSNIDRIRHRAAEEDEGQILILVLTIVTALISLGGIMVEMGAAKSLQGDGGWEHIALAGITVLLSWTFTHTMFAIHYAHEYYAESVGGLSEGLEFTQDDQPDYWDF